MTVHHRRAPRWQGLVGGIVVVAVMVAGCTRTEEPEVETMGPDEMSRLDEAGLERVRESGVLRLDLRDLPLAWESLGVSAAPGGMVMVGSASEPEVAFELVTATGVLADQASTVAVVGDGDDVEAVRWWGSAADDEEAREDLVEITELLGITDDRVAFWWDSVEYTRLDAAPERLRLVIGYGYSPTGLITWVEGTFSPDTGTHVFQKVAVTDPRYYEPQVLEQILAQIEETGSFDVDLGPRGGESGTG